MHRLANKPIKLHGEKDISEMITNREPIIGSGIKRLVLVGKSGKGKTRFLLKWLTMIHKPYEGVYIIAHMKERQETYQSIEHHCKQQKIPYKMIFKGDDAEKGKEKQAELWQKLKALQNKPGGPAPSCVIFDDINEKIADDLTLNMIKWCFSMGRHSFIYPVNISQDVKSAPRSTLNASFFCVFPMGVKGHINRSTLVGLTDIIPYEQLKVLYKFIINHKYTCILLNSDDPEKSVIMMPDEKYFFIEDISQVHKSRDVYEAFEKPKEDNQEYSESDIDSDDSIIKEPVPRKPKKKIQYRVPVKPPTTLSKSHSHR